MQDLAHTTIYNFKGLQDRFTEMDFEDILSEYHYVTLKKRDFLESNLPEDIKFMHVEPLQEACDYLGHYIAMSACNTFGYEF